MNYKCKYCKTTLSESDKRTHQCSSMPHSTFSECYTPSYMFTTVSDDSSGSYSSSSDSYSGGGGSFDGGGASGDY